MQRSLQVAYQKLTAEGLPSPYYPTTEHAAYQTPFQSPSYLGRPLLPNVGPSPLVSEMPTGLTTTPLPVEEAFPQEVEDSLRKDATRQSRRSPRLAVEVDGFHTPLPYPPNNYDDSNLGLPYESQSTPQETLHQQLQSHQSSTGERAPTLARVSAPRKSRGNDEVAQGLEKLSKCLKVSAERESEARPFLRVAGVVQSVSNQLSDSPEFKRAAAGDMQDWVASEVIRMDLDKEDRAARVIQGLLQGHDVRVSIANERISVMDEATKLCWPRPLSCGVEVDTDNTVRQSKPDPDPYMQVMEVITELLPPPLEEVLESVPDGGLPRRGKVMGDGFIPWDHTIAQLEPNTVDIESRGTKNFVGNVSRPPHDRHHRSERVVRGGKENIETPPGHHRQKSLSQPRSPGLPLEMVEQKDVSFDSWLVGQSSLRTTPRNNGSADLNSAPPTPGDSKKKKTSLPQRSGILDFFFSSRKTNVRQIFTEI